MGCVIGCFFGICIVCMVVVGSEDENDERQRKRNKRIDLSKKRINKTSKKRNKRVAPRTRYVLWRKAFNKTKQQLQTQ